MFFFFFRLKTYFFGGNFFGWVAQVGPVLTTTKAISRRFQEQKIRISSFALRLNTLNKQVS